MKISNSKKELARIISENGGWRDGAGWATQDSDGGVYDYSGNKPIRHNGIWVIRTPGEVLGWKIFHATPIKNWHQTVLSRDEYFYLYPAPDADGWIEWKSGECPVGEGVLIDVKKLNGTTELAVSNPEERIWDDPEHRYGIISYRLHKPEQSEASQAERDDQVWTNPPSIEQLAADYRNAKDYAERKQQEADEAKAEAEAKLAELVAAGKAIGLALSVEREGGAVTPIHPPLIAGDWRSWRQWEVGDFVSWSILGHIGDFKIIAVHHDASRSIGDFEIEDSLGGVYRAYGNECKFIRRP